MQNVTEVWIRGKAEKIVIDYIEKTLNKGQYSTGVYFLVAVVWQCWILGNMKFLITSDLPDGRYFEVTYNASKEEFYLDVYLDVYVRVHNEAKPFDFDILPTGEAPA